MSTRTSSVDSTSATMGRFPVGIWVLTAGTFLMGTTEFVVAGLLPELAHDYDVSIGSAGLAITVFAVGMIIGAPAMALLTLRMPRRITLALALAVFAIGHLVVALSDSFAIMLLARFVTALSTGAFWAVAAVVAARLVGPQHSSRALGIVVGGGMLASVIGVPLGSFGGQLVGWRGPFWVLAMLAAVAALVVIRAIPADAQQSAKPSMRKEIAALGSVRMWLTLAICVAVNAATLTTYSFISPLLVDRTGIAPNVVPAALALFGVASLIGSIIGGRFGDRWTYRTIGTTATVTLLASALLLLFADSTVSALVLFGLLGLVGVSANPILVALTVRFGGDAPTLPSAMATSMFNVGTAVGTGVSTPLIASSLGTSAPLLVGTISAALVFVPLLILAVSQRHPRPLPERH